MSPDLCCGVVRPRPATHTATASSASSWTDSSIAAMEIVSTVAVTRDRTTVTTQTVVADDAGTLAHGTSSTLLRGTVRSLSYVLSDERLAEDLPGR